MQRFLRQRGVEFAWAIVALAICATGGNAHQAQQVEDFSIIFHAAPNDRPIANQPSAVWVQIKQGDSIVSLADCHNCRLSLLAPDGQLLNQFDGDELQPVGTMGHAGAFGTTMIFGAAGDFLVQVEGSVNGQPIDLLFSVPVQD
jgi:hypothetical protein